MFVLRVAFISSSVDEQCEHSFVDGVEQLKTFASVDSSDSNRPRHIRNLICLQLPHLHFYMNRTAKRHIPVADFSISANVDTLVL